MKLLLTGLSHKTAPLQLREKLALSEAALPEALHQLQRTGASEAVILSTCNRVEFAVSVPDDAAASDVTERFLREWQGSAAPFAGHLYHLESKDAIRHLFRVAASLDSMVVGEPQILGQLKAAYAAAKLEGSVGGLLENVMTRAFNVAKRVRSETGIGEMAVSVSYAAVELARRIFDSLQNQSVIIIGSGKMGELAARHLRRSGANRIFVTNRTWDRALQMAAEFDGQAVEYERFAGMLHEIDIVIASSAAPHFILTREEMQRVMGLRKNKPMFLIDIAVPRNIDPAVNEIEGVFLYNVDDLARVVNANVLERAKLAEKAEAIVAEEVEQMIARLRVGDVAPVIVSLQEQFETIRSTEMTRLLRRMQGLTPEQIQQVEAMTKAMINKIAHGPISELRRNAMDPDGDRGIEILRKAFRLGD